MQQTGKSIPEQTLRVRVNLAAYKRVECPVIVEVPGEASLEADELEQVVSAVKGKADGTDYHEDVEYWKQAGGHAVLAGDDDTSPAKFTAMREGSRWRLEESHRVDEIRLPCFGITIRLACGKDCGSISSNLKAPARDDKGGLFNAAIGGLESLILAHACAGVDVESPAYIEGIETAVEAIVNNV